MYFKNLEMQYLPVIQHGLESGASRPKKVIIAGAGIAGLVAAYELLRAGHDPIILEAQGRLGGRIHTLREPFAPGLYAEAGAMRIPNTHRLTMAYIEKFGLRISPFKMNNPEGYYFINGRRLRNSRILGNLDRLGFNLNEIERSQSPAQMWQAALQPIIDRLHTEGESVWEQISAENDSYSVREFLELQGWSEDAQRWGSLTPQERISQAIENLAQIHPQILETFEAGISKMWHDDEYVGGAFALFDPGQQSLLHQHIIAPEGRYHFAGEHASLFHAWIQGAIESGLRAAIEVHQS